MRISYILMNSFEQDQIDEYKALCHADKTFVDVATQVGDERPEFEKMYYELQPTDTLVLLDMSHVVYQIDDMLDLLKDLQSHGVKVEFVRNEFVFTPENADLVIKVLGAGKLLERQFHRLRQKEGMAVAASKGIYAGRPKIEINNFETIFTKWKTGEYSAITASKKMKLSRATFYRRLDEFEETYKEIMKDRQDEMVETTPRKRGRRPKNK